MLQSHAYFSLITKPTRVTVSSQTVIDHILTNDCRSLITPGVFSYKISDHSPIFVSSLLPILTSTKLTLMPNTSIVTLTQ